MEGGGRHDPVGHGVDQHDDIHQEQHYGEHHGIVVSKGSLLSTCITNHHGVLDWITNVRMLVSGVGEDFIIQTKQTDSSRKSPRKNTWKI